MIARFIAGLVARSIALFWRALRALATYALALLILFEEWGWEPLQRALAVLGRLPLLRWVEARIAALPPLPALALFALPALLLLPVKIAALWLVGRGQPWLGLGVIVGAKLVGTAVVARLFTLTCPALMRMTWFASLHARWTIWKNALLVRVRASRPWRIGRALKRRARRRWARWRATLRG